MGREPPCQLKPWNKIAITANCEVANTSGNDNEIDVMYTLLNDTDDEHKVAEELSVHFGILTKQF